MLNPPALIPNTIAHHPQLNSKLGIKHTYIFVTLDIKSLFTQVPLKELIEDTIKTIYDKNTISDFKVTKITKKHLKKDS